MKIRYLFKPTGIYKSINQGGVSVLREEEWITKLDEEDDEDFDEEDEEPDFDEEDEDEWA